MSDAREGIVRLELPDGRSVALQLTYDRIDVRGHGWLLEQLDRVQRAKGGSARAIADLLEILTGGVLRADEIMAAPVSVYPIGVCTPAIWKAWEIGYYGPAGRPGTEAAENPPKRRPTLWGRLIGRR